jgi:uncharacterized protein (UPF0264 family)
MNETIRFLGWTDEVNACDLCGKTGLKSTAAIEIDGEIVYYGCDCAARFLTGKLDRPVKTSEVRREVERAHEGQVACTQAFESGLYNDQRRAALAEIAKLPKEIGFKVGVDLYGRVFDAAVQTGRRSWDRFKSEDLNEVVAWLKARL